jgi:hypothetical protein
MESSKGNGWFATALVLAMFALYVIANATPLPTVQMKEDGTCVRVLAIEDGKEVVRKCGTINLKHDHYNHEYVFDTDAETRAFAQEVASELAKKHSRQ